MGAAAPGRRTAAAVGSPAISARRWVSELAGSDSSPISSSWCTRRSWPSRVRSCSRCMASAAAARSATAVRPGEGAAGAPMTSRPQSRSGRPSRVTSQPLLASHAVRAGRPDVARAAFPVVEEAAVVGRVGRTRDVVDDPVLRALEDHGRPGEPLRGGQDLGRAGLGDAQLGEGVVHALGLPQLGELLVDQPLADGLRDGREPDLPAQRDQRQPALLALRRPGRPAAPTTAGPARRPGRPRRTPPGSPTNRGQRLVVVGQRDAGRQHQVAAAQQRADVGELGGVHPADLAVERRGAREHLGVRAADGGHLQHVARGSALRHHDRLQPAPRPDRSVGSRRHAAIRTRWGDGARMTITA